MSADTPSAVLFDLDGVLVRSEETWFRVVEESGLRFRGRAVTREEFSPTFGQGTDADVRGFGLGCTPRELDAFYLERFEHHAGELWTNPEAAPLLTELRERRLTLAVVTNTVTALARQILVAAKLDGFFSAICCADQVPHAKPAPDLVVAALERLSTPAQNAWMIGDSRYDREAARAAGVFFVGLGLDGDARIEHLRELALRL